MTAPRKPGDDLKTVLAGLALLWLCFLGQIITTIIFGFPLEPVLGVMPREWSGLIGILTAPLLHADWAHLTANTLALAILGYLSLRTAPGGTAIAIPLAMICGGLLAWTTGAAHHPHIGASGIAFGLMGMLLVNGFVRGGCGPLLATVVVILLFGGAVATVLQTRSPDGALLSWQMHAGGLIGGAAAAWMGRKRSAA